MLSGGEEEEGQQEGKILTLFLSLEVYVHAQIHNWVWYLQYFSKLKGL